MEKIIGADASRSLPPPIGDGTVACHDLGDYFSPEEWARAAKDDITLEAVRQALGSLHGSLSDAVIGLRNER